MMRLRYWLHRRGMWYSPSADMLWEQGTLLRPGASRWAELWAQIRRQRLDTLKALGWVPCSMMEGWDISYSDMPEPLRWQKFACSLHVSHEYVTLESGERVYLGKPVA